jgi:beta-lactamase class D
MLRIVTLFAGGVIALLVAGFVAPTPSDAAAAECTLVLDAATGKPLHRRGICDRRFSPASTFKIALSLIGFDAGVLRNDRAPAWDYQPHMKALPRDQKRVDPTIWMRDSILWYSREIALALGPQRFASYVSSLEYGNADVSGDPGRNNGTTQAWISSSLQISADEQARFLYRLVNRNLPVSEAAYALTETIMPRFETEGGWVVHGKTGMAWHRDQAGRLDSSRAQGWFVGWADKGGRRIVFARVEAGRGDASPPLGQKVRDAFLGELPSLVDGSR